MNRPSRQKSNFPRQAIVLAAGLGSRLRPLTQRIPKPALPVGGVPILLYNLFLLKEHGIRNITVNLHHLPHHLYGILSKAKALGIRLQFSREKSILGTAGGIAQALRKMKNETTFVLNGDIISDLDLETMFRGHREKRALATLACVGKNRAAVKSFVEYDREGKIFRIAGGPAGKTPPLTQGIFTGAHLLEPMLLKDYPKNSYGCIVRQVYQPALKAGLVLGAYRHRGEWWDLGDISELKKVDRLFWSERAPAAMDRIWREVYRWSGPLFYNP